ncbi:MAG: putative integral rane protein [Gemmatimonadetes bacterium]|nr:putative integral rane protein [Gemmatimonadota bacterium]
MASVALRPRSPSEIVDAAFQILRAHYAQFVMCSALAYAPWLVVQLIVAGDPQIAARTSVWVGALLAMGIWLIFALMSAVLIVCASQAYLGDPVDVGTAVRQALPRLPTVLLGAIARYACMFLGMLFFLVGALYVGARLFAVTPVIVLENQSVPRAFARSSMLSDGRKRHVINTLGLVAVIYWVLAIGVQLAAVLVGGAVVQAIITALYTIMVYPVVAITEALLYYDTRIKSEGLDIELMAGALGVAAPREPASY